MKISICLLPFLLLHFFIAQAQTPTKEELQRKTQELLKEIEAVKQSLELTKNNKKQTLGVLRAIERKMDIREKVITNIKTEVWMVEKEIIKTYRDIDTLKAELKTLKSQYAQSIVYAYKNRSNYDFLNFIFSSTGFSDALKRISYLKTYRSFREQKADDIARTQRSMQDKIAFLSGKRQEKSVVLASQNAQMNELESEKKEKDGVVAQLQGKERELAKLVTNKEKERRQIQLAIAAVIRREKEEAIRLERAEAARRKAAEEAAKKNGTNNANNTTASTTTGKPPVSPVGPTRKASVLENTPEGLITSQKFEENKGRLPWPVDKGVVTLYYGKNIIPQKTKPLTVMSDGWSIETNFNANVKAVFDGVVKSVFNVGDKQLVLIQHGKYFTTYGNLSAASVTKGQKVTAGQAVGKAGINDEGAGEVTFQLDTEVSNIDPRPWLRSK